MAKNDAGQVFKRTPGVTAPVFHGRKIEPHRQLEVGIEFERPVQAGLALVQITQPEPGAAQKLMRLGVVRIGLDIGLQA